MNVLVKSSNGITQVSADAKLLSQRKVFIEGEISPETACEFIKKIIVLNAENQEKFIDVLINSPGGEINSGLAMYDVIQSSKAQASIKELSANLTNLILIRNMIRGMHTW